MIHSDFLRDSYIVLCVIFGVWMVNRPTHRWIVKLLNCRRYGGSLVGDMVAQWSVMWWLIGRRCVGLLVGDVVAHWSEMWGLIGRRCGGSMVVDMVVHWSEIWLLTD